MNKEELKAKVDYEFSHRFNHTLHAYIDISDDLIAGTLLSQIMFWFSETKDKKRKIRIYKDGNYWLAKGREEWVDEIRISKKQYDNAIKKLKEKKFVETKLFKFNGVPTTHIRPIYENINSAIAKWKDDVSKEICCSFSDLPKGENGISLNGEKDIPHSANSLTENTYIDNNTDNNYAFSKEKGSSCFSCEKAVGQSNVSDVKYPIDDVPYLVGQYAEPNTLGSRIIDLRNIILYFIDRYNENSNTRHIDVSDSAIKSIVDAYFHPTGKVVDCEAEDYMWMIDDYFATDYKMNGRRVSKSLQHFFSGKIRENIYMKRI